MKKHALTFLISIFGGVLLSFLLKGVSGGFSLSFGWGGMFRFLDKMGWPLSWRTECSANNLSPRVPQVPTGCMDGLNPVALLINVLIFSIVLIFILKFTLFFIKFRKKK